MRTTALSYTQLDAPEPRLGGVLDLSRTLF